MGIRSSTRRVRGSSSKEQYLVFIVALLSDRGQINVGHVGPLMAQQTGDLKMGVQSTCAALDQFHVLLRGVGVSKSMEGQRTISILLKIITIGVDEKLKLIDGAVGGGFVRHQQLVSAFGAFQLLSHGDGDLLIDGNGADLAAFAPDGDSVLTQCLFCRGRVNAEALVDTQTGEASQI